MQRDDGKDDNGKGVELWILARFTEAASSASGQGLTTMGQADVYMYCVK